MSNQSPILPHALAYARKGWRVVPLWWIREPHNGYPSRCACPAGVNCNSPGKHPITTRGCLDATTTPVVIQAWWSEHPHANIGIATGKDSGITVLDVDVGGDKKGAESYNHVIKKYGQPGLTPQAITGSGGLHVVFEYAPITNKTNILPGLDIRGDGGYIVAPPSMHISGNRYEWRPDRHPAKIQRLAPVPDWLMLLCNPPTIARPKQARPQNAKGDLRNTYRKVGDISEGGRNDKLYKLGVWIASKTDDERTVVEAIELLNNNNCKPPLLRPEVEALTKNVLKSRAFRG